MWAWHGPYRFKHVVFLYYSNLLSVYIWYDLRNILMCVFYKSLIWLRSLPCASFISRALMCLSTWVCAIGSCFWVFVYCYLIKDRLPCSSTLSEHCNWKQHTVISGWYSETSVYFLHHNSLELASNCSLQSDNGLRSLDENSVNSKSWRLWGITNAFLSSQQHSVPWKHTFTVSILHEHAL